MAIFNSYVTNYQRVVPFRTAPSTVSKPGPEAPHCDPSGRLEVRPDFSKKTAVTNGNQWGKHVFVGKPSQITTSLTLKILLETIVILCYFLPTHGRFNILSQPAWARVPQRSRHCWETRRNWAKWLKFEAMFFQRSGGTTIWLWLT